MMKLKIITVLVIFLSSCAGYRKAEFSYIENGQTRTARFVIPSGYKKVREERDAAGNTIRFYEYRNARFYLAHLIDTSRQLQPIVYGLNIARIYEPTGAIVFKGQDAQDEYWREVRQGSFRAGYTDVSTKLEHRFDSATNFLLVQPIR